MIIAMLATLLSCLLGAVAFAVDVTNGYVVRGILQHAVDDAARTAERWSAQVGDAGVDPNAVLAEAVAQGLAAAGRDVQAHGLGAVTKVESAMAGSRLRIAARASVRTWFLRVFRIMSLSPAAFADAVLWSAAASVGTTAASGPASAPPAAPSPTVPSPPPVIPALPSWPPSSTPELVPPIMPFAPTATPELVPQIMPFARTPDGPPVLTPPAFAPGAIGFERGTGAADGRVPGPVDAQPAPAPGFDGTSSEPNPNDQPAPGPTGGDIMEGL